MNRILVNIAKRFVMKSLFIIVLTIISFNVVNAQKLNKFGKIMIDEIPPVPDHRIERVDGVYKVFNDSLSFDGNSFYRLPDGYITSLEVADDKKDFIKRYDLKGKLLVTILSDRIINLKISEKANYLAFYNTQNIIHINLNNYKVDTLNGSHVFEFVENEKIIYFNPECNKINFNKQQIEVEEYPYQFIDYNGKILVITEKHIYALAGNKLTEEYTFEGNFFDAKIISKEFFFVDKTEKRKTERFTLYKTSDFSKIIIADILDDLNR